MIEFYLEPKIRSASGAPLGGTYFGRFSRFKFNVGADAPRLLELLINSKQTKTNHVELLAFRYDDQLTLFAFLLFHSC